MKYGSLHPIIMIVPVIATVLFGRVLPTWTLSLATVAASNALVALGIVILARTGNVSFGQGLFFAAGGYSVALIGKASGITDAVVQVLICAACGGLLGFVLFARVAPHGGGALQRGAMTARGQRRYGRQGGERRHAVHRKNSLQRSICSRTRAGAVPP